MHVTVFRLNGFLLRLFMMCPCSPVVFTPNSEIRHGKEKQNNTKQKGAPAQGQSIPGNVPAHPIGQSYNERAMEMSRNTVHKV